MKEQFTLQLEIYAKWKSLMTKNIKSYQQWLVKQGMNEAEDDLRIFEVIDSLNSDRLTVSFVAEFSRGKTELINAIFFSSYKRRLLPSSAGRTTMCPTELFYDNVADESYIRLLPIETRGEETTITGFKQEPTYWQTMPLDVNNPEAMAETFMELIKTKTVPADIAKRLGLYTDDHVAKELKEVEIPAWRHAMISFPHPMLKQGLVILDTPGLNALGNEPELTMELIPQAQAVLFILAADTGVTRSDQEIWQHHIMPYINPENTGVLVALNKIDTLWDELKDEATVAANIKSQRESTAKELNIKLDKVFPISAQKGLLARVKQDEALLRRSGLLVMETCLSADILPAKQRIVRENLLNKIGGRIESTKELLTGRFEAAKEQLKELQSLSGKNTDVIMQLMDKARESQAVYKVNVENFQTSKHVLTQQVKAVMDTLSLEGFDKMISKTRNEMVSSWTTGGMKTGMKFFFENARTSFDQVAWQADKSNEIVKAIYQRFREDHNIDVKPELFTTKKYMAQLERLYREAEAFRNSPVTTMTEQSFVVKKFFVQLVSHSRNILFQARQDAEVWAKNVMRPLADRIKERKDQLDQHLESLQKIKQSREKLDEKIQELEEMCRDLSSQITTIDSILKAINTPLPTLGKRQAGAKSKSAVKVTA